MFSTYDLTATSQDPDVPVLEKPDFVTGLVEVQTAQYCSELAGVLGVLTYVDALLRCISSRQYRIFHQVIVLDGVFIMRESESGWSLQHTDNFV